MTRAADDTAVFPPCRARTAPAPTLSADALQLFCLPHAGAGASVYKDWPQLFAPGIEAIPVQFPGREGRHGEPVLDSAAKLVEAMLDPVANRVGREFALFGHSMGALISYELAHELCALGKPPRHLFVSGLGAPHLPRWPLLNQLPDDELVQAIARLEGTSAEVLDQPELLQFLLPTFRADLRVWETYVADRGPLPVPITAMGGRDDPSVAVANVEAWGSLTSAEFRLEVFDGGHFYHLAAQDDLVAVIKKQLGKS